jgi:lipoyl(octanoyl) transferase
MDEIVTRRASGLAPDTLLLLEHTPTVTLGRGSSAEHVRWSNEALRDRGIEVHECGRGGDVTYHGPGQLVGYPILALEGARRDAHRYLRDLEEALIRTAADLGVLGERVSGLTGVWVGDSKLAAIGVRISSGWVTSHGFAMNVHGDLSGFDAIVPCGLHDRGVTSLESLTGARLPLAEVAAMVARRVAEVLDFPLIFEIGPEGSGARDE